MGGFMDGIAARKAMMQHQKGDYKSAMATYTSLYEKGYVMCSYLLPYTVLLLREGGEENYLKVKEILKKAEKAPDVNDDHRQQIFTNYAVAQYKLGKLPEALHLLETAQRKNPCGVIYETLGYLYIEKAAQRLREEAEKPAPVPAEEAAEEVTEAVEEAAEDAAEAASELAQAPEAPEPTVQDEIDKALQYNLEALDYDDEDAVTLDNLGQLYYRVIGDKVKAKEYFDKAHEIKPGQIDTLYFLAQYDLAEGKRTDAVEKLKKTLEGRFSPLNFATRAGIEAQLKELGA